jgi:phosphoglycolate phosphatase-like HAD superfamily hydrolase
VSPDILALDFDGVLCEGSREYFESSRRAYRRVWPDAPAPADGQFPLFRALRPVIEHGWEMPLLLLAITLGTPAGPSIGLGRGTDRCWPATGGRAAAADRLGHALDDERRRWLAADAPGWLDHHAPYGPLDELRRVVGGVGLTVIVTTKEGEFTRRILDHWDVPVAGVEGKETGRHKCDNLRQLIAARTAGLGRRARLWFVEDRLETLEHVTTHATWPTWLFPSPGAKHGAAPACPMAHRPPDPIARRGVAALDRSALQERRAVRRDGTRRRGGARRSERRWRRSATAGAALSRYDRPPAGACRRRVGCQPRLPAPPTTITRCRRPRARSAASRVDAPGARSAAAGSGPSRANGVLEEERLTCRLRSRRARWWPRAPGRATAAASRPRGDCCSRPPPWRRPR